MSASERFLFRGFNISNFSPRVLIKIGSLMRASTVFVLLHLACKGSWVAMGIKQSSFKGHAVVNTYLQEPSPLRTYSSILSNWNLDFHLIGTNPLYSLTCRILGSFL